MSSTTEQIKERLSIIDVVSTYVKLERAGKNFKGKCPFHNEKTPSFFISPDRDSYYCFGCGRGGDIFTFVQEFEGIDFMGALGMLAERAGVDIKPVDTKVKDLKDRIFSCLESAVQFYEDKLQDAQEVRTYLTERGLSVESIKRFRIGFAPKGWTHLYDALKQGQYTDAELQGAGLTKERGEQKGYYDAFRSRIMFPVRDTAGRAIAFSGRIFGEESEAKYINSPETLIFKKSRVLYGFDMAKHTIRKKDFAVLTEGTFDVVLAHQVGYTNTVAPLGTSLTGEHLRILSHLSKNLVLALDADDAGVASAKRSARLALHEGFDVKVARLPDGKDPADVIQEDPDVWRQAIKEAQHVIDFLMSVLKHHAADDRAYELSVRKEVLPFVALIENKMDQGYFVKAIAEVLNIDEGAVYAELEKVDADMVEKPAYEAPDAPLGTNKPQELVQKELATLVLWKESQDRHKEAAALQEKVSEILGVAFEEVIQRLPREELLFEAEAMFAGSADAERTETELLNRIHEQVIRDRVLEVMHELRTVGDTAKAEPLLKELQELTKQLDTLRTHTT